MCHASSGACPLLDGFRSWIEQAMCHQERGEGVLSLSLCFQQAAISGRVERSRWQGERLADRIVTAIRSVDRLDGMLDLEGERRV